MDYLEGLLLGSQWSDTDFENRRHYASLVLYSVILIAVVGYSYLTGSLSQIIIGNEKVKLVFFLILFFACPFICFRYYRFPIWGKIPILLLQSAKQLILSLFIMGWARSKMTLLPADLKDAAIEMLNTTLEEHTLRYSETAGTFATVLGVISGGVYIVLVFFAYIVVAVLVPALIFVLVRFLQLGYDKIVARVLFADHINH